MDTKRSWYTDYFKKGNKILKGGITEDPIRRDGELMREINSRGHLKIEGRAKTEDGARDWEREHGFS